MFRALCAHHQEVKIVLYSIWCYHACRLPSRAPFTFPSLFFPLKYLIRRTSGHWLGAFEAVSCKFFFVSFSAINVAHLSSLLPQSPRFLSLSLFRSGLADISHQICYSWAVKFEFTILFPPAGLHARVNQ